jgi:hypothetical protein
MSSFLTQLNIRAAKDANMPTKPINQTHTKSKTLIPQIYNDWLRDSDGQRERARESTREVVDERDLDGAADDGVHPEPPTGAEYDSRDAWPEDCPQLRQIHLLKFSIHWNKRYESDFGDVFGFGRLFLRLSLLPATRVPA